MIIDRTKPKTENQQKDIYLFKEKWSDIESDIFLLKKKLEAHKTKWISKKCKGLKHGDKVKLWQLDKERNFVFQGYYFIADAKVNRDGEIDFYFNKELKDGSVGKRKERILFAKLEKA